MKKWEEFKAVVHDMESNPVLKFSERWYDLTREEQIDLNFKRFATLYHQYKHKYFKEFKPEYVSFYFYMFQGLVRTFNKICLLLLEQIRFLKQEDIFRMKYDSNNFVVPLQFDFVDVLFVFGSTRR